jgi:hypothetical protein
LFNLRGNPPLFADGHIEMPIYVTGSTNAIDNASKTPGN